MLGHADAFLGRPIVDMLYTESTQRFWLDEGHFVQIDVPASKLWGIPPYVNTSELFDWASIRHSIFKADPRDPHAEREFLLSIHSAQTCYFGASQTEQTILFKTPGATQHAVLVWYVCAMEPPRWSR